ncbi:DNA-binding transcriptional regulator, MerR family [Clostridium sp. DSM 8431]|uniref:MerR family transcriptional regulator n=1 Tax=Clostridium sp. DSM 8431 TaxID=1761781 RepID=UPI0008F186B9|nr:MerR family transcriptional regulator [Clostridium sp. DSM 8431]SFU31717.1 DNA-binding transcriptional regulator, MerR family [Clostridium sp. DSM 8431]
MKISDVSERTGLSIDNLRYYERIGLIPPIPRNKLGIREYDERAIHWIEFVLNFKEAGASLESIIDYIKLAQSENDSKEARREILFEIKKDLEKKMAKLQKCMDLTDYKIANYDNLCNPVTEEMIEEWKSNQNKHEEEK